MIENDEGVISVEDEGLFDLSRQLRVARQRGSGHAQSTGVWGW